MYVGEIKIKSMIYKCTVSHEGPFLSPEPYFKALIFVSLDYEYCPCFPCWNNRYRADGCPLMRPKKPYRPVIPLADASILDTALEGDYNKKTSHLCMLCIHRVSN